MGDTWTPTGNAPSDSWTPGTTKKKSAPASTPDVPFMGKPAANVATYLRTAKAQQEERDSQPLWHTINEALGYGNTGGTLLGAAQIDLAHGRNPLAGLADSPMGKPISANTSFAHAMNMLSRGQSQEAAEEYFPTGIGGMKKLAKGTQSTPLLSALNATPEAAREALKHPRQSAIGDFAARILDPSNAVFGVASETAGATARGAIGAAGRGAADVITKIHPAAEFKPVTQALRAADHVMALKRFAIPRAAAEHIARKAGKSEYDVWDAGNRAEMASRNMANAQVNARAEAQDVVHEVFGGLDKGEQFELVHLHEGMSSLKPGDPLYQKLMPRVEYWRKYGAELDALTRRWIGDDARFLSPQRYFPRKGFARATDEDPLSAGEEALIEASRSRGGVTVRKGTLGEKIHRKHSTLQGMMADSSGTARFDLDPTWTPAKALEEHVATRVQANTIYDQMHELESLGLVRSKWIEPPIKKKIWKATKPPLPGRSDSPGPQTITGLAPFMKSETGELLQPEGKLGIQSQRTDPGDFGMRTTIALERIRNAETLKRAIQPGLKLTPSLLRAASRGAMKSDLKSITRTVSKGVPAARPSGYVPFTELGDVRTFGLPLTRESYIDPAVHTLLKEVRGMESDGATGVAGLFSRTADAVNRAAATWQVQFAPYHIAINLQRNIESALRSPAELERFWAGFHSPEAMEHAHQTGAVRRYASRLGAPETEEALPELGQIARKGLRAFEKVSAEPLYRVVEPRIAAGLQYALEPRLGRAGAALEVRSILGEPENIMREMKGASKALEFPAWFLSQMRRWTAMPFKRPELINAPQAAIEDWNAGQGRSRKASDSNRYLPPIMLGHTKDGDNIVLEIPHPGDRPLRFMSSLGSGGTAAASAVAGGVAPLAQPVTKFALDAMREKMASGTWEHDVASAAPPNTDPWWKQIMNNVGATAGFYGNPIPHLVHTELTPGREAKRRKIISAFVYGNRKYGPDFKYGILDFRRAAAKYKTSDPARAARDTGKANARYKEMQDYLARFGFARDPLAPADNQTSWMTGAKAVMGGKP